MHFWCGCGRRISDTTDRLPYKACFLANEDEIDYCDALEQLIKDENLSAEEKAMRAAVTLQVRYLCRCIYQCPDCGRLFVDDHDYKLHSFVPEEPVDKHLLTASREE